MSALLPLPVGRTAPAASSPASTPSLLSRVAVVVPARNEQEIIGDCLRHLDRARAALARSSPEVTVNILVVLDRCTDATAAIVDTFDVLALTVQHGQVGRTRAAGADAAMTRAEQAGCPPTQLWLASTDADSRVPEDWILSHVDLAQQADAVIGTVEPWGVSDPWLEQEWWRRHDLGEGHGHVHGANLGLRADLYRRVGGYRDLGHGEDVDLVERVRAHTTRWVATDRGRVPVSGRLAGRCDGGFASYLSDLRSKRR